MCWVLTTGNYTSLIVNSLSLGASAKVVFGPIADANHHNSGQDDTCDPDLGWLAGADGAGKCYMLVKGFDYR